MKRLLALVVVLSLAGCGPSKPVAVPPSTPGNGPSLTPPAEPPAPTVSTNASSKVAAKPPAPEPIEVPSDDPAREWISQLADSSEEVREAAVLALNERGAAATPALLAAMKDKSPETRRAVAYFLLEQFSASDDRVAAALRDALADDDRKVRQLALQAAKRMPPESAALAVGNIAALLDIAREEPVNRADAARLLGKLESAAKDGLPALLKTAATDPSEKVRAPALFSITRIAEPAEALAPLVQALQKDKDAGVRLVAASGLGRLGPAAAPAAQDLANALDDADDKVRRAASDALVGVSSQAVIPLAGQLESKNPRTRELALFTLGRLGVAARPAISAIEKRTKDEDAAVKKMAERVLESLRPS